MGLIEGVQRVHPPHLITHVYAYKKSIMEGRKEANPFTAQTDRGPVSLPFYPVIVTLG